MRHEFELDGVFINPKLSEDFNCTPHEQRDDEMNWWWGKPYIIISELSLESWEEFYYRLKDDASMKEYLLKYNKETWNKQLEEDRKSWFKKYPTGFKYTVRCLDGGAWDRSTKYGDYASFEEAMDAAKNISTNS